LSKNSRGQIKWKDSVGRYITVYCNDIVAKILVKEVRDSKHICFEYNGKTKITSSEKMKKGWLIDLIINPSLIQLYQLGEVVEPKNKLTKFKIINYGVQRKDNVEKIVYTCKCSKCRGEFKREQRLLREYACPLCSPWKIRPLEESNITITDPWMIPYFQGGFDEAKLYRKSEKTKIYPVCPNCGKVKNQPISIRSLHEFGFGCTCSSSISFPERFMISLLDQLDIEYYHQPSAKFLGFEDSLKRYDFYIPKFSMIIETHGRQHYKNGDSSSWQTAEEQQGKDKYKRDLAIKNGIKYYIELDCRASTLKWLKDSVMNSILPSLFLFAEKDVDWNKCIQFKKKPIVKQVCDDYRENFMTVKELMRKYRLTKTTINRYLHDGDERGWCIFKKGYNTNLKPIEVMKNGKHIAYFTSPKDAYNNSKKEFGKVLYDTRICNALKNNKTYLDFSFKYVDDNNIPLKWKIIQERMIANEIA